MCGCLSHAPCWGPGQQPRHVPWLGIKPATLCFTGQHSIHWAYQPGPSFFIFKVERLIFSSKLNPLSFFNFITDIVADVPIFSHFPYLHSAPPSTPLSGPFRWFVSAENFHAVVSNFGVVVVTFMYWTIILTGCASVYSPLGIMGKWMWWAYLFCQ